MKILQTIESLNPEFGGTVEAVLQLTRAFARLGVYGDILTLDGPEQVWETGLPPEQVHRAGPPRTFYRYCGALKPWFRRHLAGYDAVLIHGLWRHHSAGTWRALRGRATPYYVVVHSMLNPWFNTEGFWKHARKSLFWRAIEHRVLAGARTVIYTSEEERRLAQQSFRPYRCREVVLPLGTAPPPAASGEEFLFRYPRLRGKRLALFLGRLHPMKGCDILLRAWPSVAARHSGAHLVMAGPDSAGWRADLEALARRGNIEQSVTFTGPLQGAQKWSAFAAAEVFVLPSHCEAFPYAVLESLGAGVPVLTTEQVNLAGILRPAGCALIGQDTEQSTAENLLRWFALPDATRTAMSLAARECFHEHFEIGTAAGRIVDFLRRDAHAAAGLKSTPG